MNASGTAGRCSSMVGSIRFMRDLALGGGARQSPVSVMLEHETATPLPARSTGDAPLAASTRALLRAGAPRPLPALHLRDLTLLASDDVARKLLKLGTLGRVEDLPTHGDRALMMRDLRRQLLHLRAAGLRLDRSGLVDGPLMVGDHPVEEPEVRVGAGGRL